MRRWTVLLVSATCLCAGCASQQEQALDRQRKLHQTIREADGEPVGKWRLKTDDD